MNKQIEVLELALIVAAQNYSPTLLNPDLLKYGEIVPNEWELARQPIFSDRMSQISYQNGVNLIAEPNRLMFVESLVSVKETELNVPKIACRYVETLRSCNYQAIGVNFRGYINLNSQTSSNYLIDNYVAPGAWTIGGTESVKASLNFVYTFKDNGLRLQDPIGVEIE